LFASRLKLNIHLEWLWIGLGAKSLFCKIFLGMQKPSIPSFPVNYVTSQPQTCNIKVPNVSDGIEQYSNTFDQCQVPPNPSASDEVSLDPFFRGACIYHTSESKGLMNES